MRMCKLILSFVLVSCLGLTACEFGQVEQGRCVAYNPETKTMLVVLDVKHDQRNPEYSGGIHEYMMPSDPAEIGPLPKPGGRVMFDIDKSTVTLYNAETKSLEVLNVKFTDVEKNIKRTHPKVRGKKFPIIDKEKMTVPNTPPACRLWLPSRFPPTSWMWIPIPGKPVTKSASTTRKMPSIRRCAS